MTEHDPAPRQRDERAEQEDPAPRGMIDDPATEQRPDRRRDGGEPGPGADRLAALRLIEGGSNDGERARDQQGRADTLRRTSHDQLRDALGKAAPNRRGSENADADDEDATSAEPIAGGAADQQQRRQGERVRVD